MLDNSIRESTVGQLCSHTLQNKLENFKQVKKVGIKDIVITSFSHMTVVDGDFVQYLKDHDEDLSHFYFLSEITEDGQCDAESIPVSRRIETLIGIWNTIFEVDLASKDIEWETKFMTDDICQLIQKLLMWVYDNISKSARILFNLRDFPVAMNNPPKQVLKIVQFLSNLLIKQQLFGFCFEEMHWENI